MKTMTIAENKAMLGPVGTYPGLTDRYRTRSSFTAANKPPTPGISVKWAELATIVRVPITP